VARAFHSDRTWTFPVDAGDLWARIAAVDEFPRMWPWLRSFDARGGLKRGAHWTCEVAPPMPYVVRFGVDFDDVEDGSHANTTIDGDIAGWARLTVWPVDGGCTARLASELAPANSLLRGVGRVARPLIEWGHDWILEQGRRQFTERSGLTGTDGH